MRKSPPSFRCDGHLISRSHESVSLRTFSQLTTTGDQIFDTVIWLIPILYLSIPISEIQVGYSLPTDFLASSANRPWLLFSFFRMCKASLIFAFISHIRNVINLTTLLISFEAYPLTYWQFRLPDDVMCLLIWRLLFWFAGKLPKIKTMFPFFTKLVTLFCEAKFQVFWS